MNSFYEFCFYFIIYAFLGWCLEVVYEAVDRGEFVNRGFLNGPYCPIYGFGVVIVTICLNPIKENAVLLYIGSVILTSFLEFVTGYILEKIFNQKWWDYTEEKFNIKGYICLKFSLLWGIACLVVVRIIHPAVEALVEQIHPLAGKTILILLFAGFISDTVITVMAILKIKKRVSVLTEISIEMKRISDKTGEKLYNKVMEIQSKNEQLAVKNEEIKKRFEELAEKYRTVSERKGFNYRRIEKAFPKLKGQIGKNVKEKIEEGIAKFKQK